MAIDEHEMRPATAEELAAGHALALRVISVASAGRTDLVRMLAVSEAVVQLCLNQEEPAGALEDCQRVQRELFDELMSAIRDGTATRVRRRRGASS